MHVLYKTATTGLFSMHGHNNPYPTGENKGLKVIGCLFLTLFLANCSSTARQSDTVSVPMATSEMQATVEAAICSGQAASAVAELSQEPLVSAVDRFYLALSLEESGHPTKAQPLYMALMQSGYNGYVRISCGSDTLVNGSLSEESARRLAIIARTLAVMDVNMRPAPPLPKGIPYREIPTSTKSDSGDKGPVLNVTRPASQSPFGSWFAHLSSYMSIEHAVNNKATLERLYPALKGIIDQWELTVKGQSVVRLGIRVQNKADAEALCQAVKSHGEYCAVMDTSS